MTVPTTSRATHLALLMLILALGSSRVVAQGTPEGSLNADQASAQLRTATRTNYLLLREDLVGLTEDLEDRVRELSVAARQSELDLAQLEVFFGEVSDYQRNVRLRSLHHLSLLTGDLGSILEDLDTGSFVGSLPPEFVTGARGAWDVYRERTERLRADLRAQLERDVARLATACREELGWFLSFRLESSVYPEQMDIEILFTPGGQPLTSSIFPARTTLDAALCVTVVAPGTPTVRRAFAAGMAVSAEVVVSLVDVEVTVPWDQGRFVARLDGLAGVASTGNRRLSASATFSGGTAWLVLGVY